MQPLGASTSALKKSNSSKRPPVCSFGSQNPKSLAVMRSEVLRTTGHDLREPVNTPVNSFYELFNFKSLRLKT